VVPVPIASISIRACPKLPPTTEKRIVDNRAQTLADSSCIASRRNRSQARGWSVHWYDASACFRDAAGTRPRDVDASCTRWADRSGRLAG